MTQTTGYFAIIILATQRIHISHTPRYYIPHTANIFIFFREVSLVTRLYLAYRLLSLARPYGLREVSQQQDAALSGLPSTLLQRGPIGLREVSRPYGPTVHSSPARPYGLREVYNNKVTRLYLAYRLLFSSEALRSPRGIAALSGLPSTLLQRGPFGLREVYRGFIWPTVYSSRTRPFGLREVSQQ